MVAFSRPTQPAKALGAYTEQSRLFGLKLQARFKLSVRRRALSALAGPYRASFRGRGVDFEEVRAYQAGDEIRSIDWRVTARTGEAHTKLFREERERPVVLIIDQRAPMFFGSHNGFKSVLAAHTAALVAWSALHQNDRVGGLVIGQDELFEVRPKRSRSSVLKLLHGIDEFNHRLNANLTAPTLSLASALEDARRIVRPGSAVFIISDFSDFNDSAGKHLFHLARHNEVTGFYTYDVLERELPPAGRYNVTDGERRALISTGTRAAREVYTEHFENRRNHLHQQLASSGIPLVEMETSCDPLTELVKYYAR
jgi:uncharacterized protein (DUF58 family)